MKKEKKVLGMILKGYPRISETFISNEIRLLEEQGIKIRIFSMRKPRENFTHKSVKQIRAEVLYLPSTLFRSLHRLLVPNLLVLAKRPGPYLKALALAGRRFTRTRKIATLKHVFQAGFLVHKGLRDGEVTHLHAHFAHSPSSVALFASMLSGLPFSFTAHAKDIYTSNPAQLKEKIDLARFVVTCTDYNRAHLQEIAGNGKEVHCVYHGIDLKLFSFNGAGPESNPPYNILTVARFVEKKGLPDVLKGLALLRDQGMDFRYHLIGDGADKDKVMRAVREHGLEDRVETPGTMPHEQVLDYYRRADLFVLGCRVAGNGDRDGIPNVLVESMALGTPVVATTVSAIPELVEHEKTGLLCPPNEPEALAQAMRRLLTDQELRAGVIKKARETVDQGFDNRRHIERLGRIYRQAGIGGTA